MHTYRLLLTLTTLLALVVVVVGAYVRLSDAGLGCPDWPGCYGRMVVPDEEHEIAAANELHPQRPLEAGKAWKEMVHRYLAGTLGLLIVILAVMDWRLRRRLQGGHLLHLLLVAVVLFQAALGMWTVTLLVMPAIVTAHLLGGMLTVSLLWWLTLSRRELSRSTLSMTEGQGSLRALALLALLVVAAQIALGGWTSTNYAALVCGDFPTCRGEWWPEMDFSQGFRIWHGTGVNYEYGVLDLAARTAIHVTHRIGALITLLVVGMVALTALRRGNGPVRRTGGFMLGFLLLQISLGIANVILGLPIWAAVAHNGVAALLLLSCVTLLRTTTVRPAFRSGF
ncbi:MAG: heme A synthase [Gammaproteobacteria bacterium]|nr:MAG: heme A synthase [Gammaproteobacteria bacterium]